MSILFVDDIRGKTTASTVQMPEGMVIQFKQHRYSDNHTCQSSDAYQDVSGSSFSFTPKLSNSKLFIESNVSVRMNDDAQGCATRIVVDGVAYDTPTQSHEWYFNMSITGTQDYYDRLVKNSFVDNTSTNTRTIKLQVSNYSGSTNTRLNFAGRFQTVITVMEIAQ